MKSVESGHSEWILLEEEDFLPTPRTDPKVIRVHKRMFFFQRNKLDDFSYSNSKLGTCFWSGKCQFPIQIHHFWPEILPGMFFLYFETCCPCMGEWIFCFASSTLLRFKIDPQNDATFEAGDMFARYLFNKFRKCKPILVVMRVLSMPLTNSPAKDE